MVLDFSVLNVSNFFQHLQNEIVLYYSSGTGIIHFLDKYYQEIISKSHSNSVVLSK